MGLPYTALGLERFCSLLRIDDQGERGKVPFLFNLGQKVLAKEIAEHPYVFCAKGRQTGASTLNKAASCAWAIERDQTNRPAECAMIWDELDKVKRHIMSMHGWLDDVGVPHEHLKLGEIWFPNGTLIKGYTAGGANPGRGMSLKRIHASEPPFWKQDPDRVWAGIRNSMGDDGSSDGDTSIVIETTMDPTVPFAQKMWDADNEYRKIFIPISLHELYRAPHLVESLTDAELEMLAEEGFLDAAGVMTDDLKASGAWWLQKLKSLGSLTWLKRDFPQKIEHCSAQDHGRWILADPLLVVPYDIIYIPSLAGRAVWEVELFVHPEDVEGRCIIAVDTSEGVGKDRSTIIVLDAETGRVCASFASEWAAFDDLAVVAAQVYRRYRIGAGAGKRDARDRSPEIVVEKNGVGSGTVRELQKAGYGVIPYTQDAERKYDGLLYAKREIEAGRAYGPQCLLNDARSCHKDGAAWKGRKDVLSALGFAHVWIQADKEAAPEAEMDNELWATYRRNLGIDEGSELF